MAAEVGKPALLFTFFSNRAVAILGNCCKKFAIELAMWRKTFCSNLEKERLQG
jgi:hypothetical protein